MSATKQRELQRNPQSKQLSAIRGYGLGIITIAVALGIGLVTLQYGFRDIARPLFLLAIAPTAWYGGARAAAVTIALAIALFAYCFAESPDSR
jgi:K+-sensing histidine kinase KdpD